MGIQDNSPPDGQRTLGEMASAEADSQKPKAKSLQPCVLLVEGVPMNESTAAPQINVSNIKAGGGIAGALFTLISMLIFLIGIPALRFFLPAAIVLGLGMALVIHFMRHETPGKAWILSATKK